MRRPAFDTNNQSDARLSARATTAGSPSCMFPEVSILIVICHVQVILTPGHACSNGAAQDVTLTDGIFSG